MVPVIAAVAPVNKGLVVGASADAPILIGSGVTIQYKKCDLKSSV